MESFENEKDSSTVTCGICGKEFEVTELFKHIREKHPKRWKELDFDD